MAKQVSQGRQWYVIHAAAGYEENVAENLKQRIASMNMGDKIFNVMVPTEKKIKIKNGKRKTVIEKVFPGYVLVEMILTDQSWYVVRNTPHVTGFIGIGTTPTALADKELKAITDRMKTEEPQYTIDVVIDDPVKIVDGPFKNLEGKVSEVDATKGKIKVLVSLFGRETPVELDYLQLKKI
ncbi:transcription termination/antitermination factor NusG [Candidatus Falkowbacteria bacterium]|nr:transcription termination/antitermination factor NusG [Candidatus Falkowbacteria bacterium]